jgi:hypothetical protein
LEEERSPDFSLPLLSRELGIMLDCCPNDYITYYYCTSCLGCIIFAWATCIKGLNSGMFY